MINFCRLALCSVCLLASCQGTIKDSSVPPKHHQINKWKLSSQGQHNWRLEAASASEFNQRWKLEDFSWSNQSQELLLSAPSAFQSNANSIRIPEFKFHIKDFKGSGLKGELNLETMELIGQKIKIQNNHSELQAESFKSKDLKKWQLQRVHMRFERP